MKTRAPSPALRKARADLRAALVRYSARLLADVGLPPHHPEAIDILANLHASDDAARRAATVAGIVDEGAES